MAWQDRQTEWENLTSVQSKLGEICMLSAAFDDRLDWLLVDLLDIAGEPPSRFKLGSSQSAKIQQAKSLVADAPVIDSEVTPQLSIALESLENLNKQRNRYIHDRWHFNIEKIEQIDVRKRRRTDGNVSTVTITDLDSWLQTAYARLSELSYVQDRMHYWVIAARESRSEFARHTKHQSGATSSA